MASMLFPKHKSDHIAVLLKTFLCPALLVESSSNALKDPVWWSLPNSPASFLLPLLVPLCPATLVSLALRQEAPAQDGLYWKILPSHPTWLFPLHLSGLSADVTFSGKYFLTPSMCFFGRHPPLPHCNFIIWHCNSLTLSRLEVVWGQTHLSHSEAPSGNTAPGTQLIFCKYLLNELIRNYSCDKLNTIHIYAKYYICKKLYSAYIYVCLIQAVVSLVL